MALIRSVFAVVRSTISRPTGTIIAPPTPCRHADHRQHRQARWPPRSRWTPGEQRDRHARRRRRAPNRSLSQPLPGMSTATVSTYAVIATLIWTAARRGLPAMAGAAGAIIVASRFSMKYAPATSSASGRTTRPAGSSVIRLPYPPPGAGTRLTGWCAAPGARGTGRPARDPRGGVVDVAQILGRQLDGRPRRCSPPAVPASARAGDGHDPRLLGQQPGERDLRRRRVLPLGDRAEQIDQGLVRLPRLRREAGDGAADVAAVERRCSRRSCR